MWRNFDNRDRYTDLNGKPLVGVVQFMIRSGNTVANIFDDNNVPLANPQVTDVLGRTAHQVFIDSDVTAYMYKYIGTGTVIEEAAHGIDTHDESKWALQYTVDNFAIDRREISGISAPGILTMDELRAVDVDEVPELDGEKIVCLHGYFAAGDCEPVYYTWDPESTLNDDNGSVISSDTRLTGRWFLVQPTEHCDSRHFGVFSQDSADYPIDQATRIGQLFDYCNKKGIRPFFNGSTEYPYFIYNTMNVSSRCQIDVSNGTVFVDKQPSTMYGDFDANASFRFLNSNTHIRSRFCKASWASAGMSGFDEVLVDAQTLQQVFTGAKVTVTVDTANKVFNNCELVSDGHLADNTFQNCVLRGAMFVGQSLSPVIDDDCTIQPLDFVDRMPLWCVLRSQQHNPIIDCCMQTLDASCNISLDGIWIKNALFDSFHHESGISIGFESCRGSVEVVCNGNPIITSEDSELVLTLTNTGEAGVGYQPAMVVHGGNVGFVSTLSFFMSFGAKNSELSGNGILVNGPASFVDCQTALPITVRGALYCTNSTINANVVHYTVSTPAFVRMQGCTLNAYYSLNPAVANSTVDAVWASNYSSIDSPILIDRTNLDPIDSHHTYTYANNSGGFLPYVTKPAVHEYTIKHSAMIGSLQPTTDPYVLTQMVLGGSDSDTNGRPSGYILPWYSSPNFDTIRMFRIGVDRFQVKAKLVVWPALLENEGTTGEYQYNRYHDALLGAYYIDGFTWGIMPFWDDPTVTPPTQLASAANPRFFKGSLSFSFNNMPSFTDYHVSMAIQYECLDRHDNTY